MPHTEITRTGYFYKNTCLDGSIDLCVPHAMNYFASLRIFVRQGRGTARGTQR